MGYSCTRPAPAHITLFTGRVALGRRWYSPLAEEFHEPQRPNNLPAANQLMREVELEGDMSTFTDSRVGSQEGAPHRPRQWPVPRQPPFSLSEKQRRVFLVCFVLVLFEKTLRLEQFCF